MLDQVADDPPDHVAGLSVDHVFVAVDGRMSVPQRVQTGMKVGRRCWNGRIFAFAPIKRRRQAIRQSVWTKAGSGAHLAFACPKETDSNSFLV